MDLTKKCLIDLIRYSVLAVSLPTDFTLVNLDDLYRLAKKHDMAHLAAYALKKNELVDLKSDIWKKFDLQYTMAQYRVISLETEYRRIREVFKAANIEYLPLKGVVIRALYPEGWMRLSADIDILVHEDEQEQAEKELEESLNYKVDKTIAKSKHDQVVSPTGFQVELHYALTLYKTTAGELLRRAWEYALPEKEDSGYRLPDEFFYLHHIHHASTHFASGGCGIRPVLDTWILNHMTTFDKSKREELLEAAGLSVFADELEKLAERWFSVDTIIETDALSSEFEDYIINGGVYGGSQHAEAFQAKTSGGCIISYYLHRAFPNYDHLHARYPEMTSRLQMPLYWGKRIKESLSNKNKKRTKQEVSTAWKNKAESDRIAELFKRLGI